MKVFGTVLVLGQAAAEPERGVRPATKWVVVCKGCPRCFIATTKQIRAGTKHCICLKETYTSWRQMRQRCNNENHKHYQNYGGRGIYVCEDWDRFQSFVLDLGKRPEGKTLDRINVDGPYSRENCRWATPKEQAQTRRPPKR